MGPLQTQRLSIDGRFIFMCIVYILYSKTGDCYYIGFTSESVETRLKKHLDHYYKNHFTARHSDWNVFYTISCVSDSQAMQIEKHLKRMKSKVYLNNLKRYPEMAEKLLERYK